MWLTLREASDMWLGLHGATHMWLRLHKANHKWLRLSRAVPGAILGPPAAGVQGDAGVAFRWGISAPGDNFGELSSFPPFRCCQAQTNADWMF